jgi:hypothetical protein
MASNNVMRRIQDGTIVSIGADRTDFTWGEIAEFAARARPGSRLRTNEACTITGFGSKKVEAPPAG